MQESDIIIYPTCAEIHTNHLRIKDLDKALIQTVRAYDKDGEVSLSLESDPVRLVTVKKDEQEYAGKLIGHDDQSITIEIDNNVYVISAPYLYWYQIESDSIFPGGKDVHYEYITPQLRWQCVGVGKISQGQMTLELAAIIYNDSVGYFLKSKIELVAEDTSRFNIGLMDLLEVTRQPLFQTQGSVYEVYFCHTNNNPVVHGYIFQPQDDIPMCYITFYDDELYLGVTTIASTAALENVEILFYPTADLVSRTIIEDGRIITEFRNNTDRKINAILRHDDGQEWSFILEPGEFTFEEKAPKK